MNTSKIEKWSPPSNVYDDLRAVDFFSVPIVPTRSTSTISYIGPRETDELQAKRSAVSLILPAPTAYTEQKRTSLETILSMDDDTKRSSPLELIEQKRKDLVIKKKHKFVYEEDASSCICRGVRLIIQLIGIMLLACLIGIFIIALIFCAVDNYWLDHPIGNHSPWWFDNNDTNFTSFDYDFTTLTVDYDPEY